MEDYLKLRESIQSLGDNAEKLKSFVEMQQFLEKVSTDIASYDAILKKTSKDLETGLNTLNEQTANTNASNEENRKAFYSLIEDFKGKFEGHVTSNEQFRERSLVLISNSFTEIHEKLTLQLGNNLVELNNQLQSNVITLAELLQRNHGEVKTDIAQFKEVIEDKVKDLESFTSTLLQTLKESNGEITQKISSLESITSQNIETLMKSIRQMGKDLEELLNSKLEKNKSDIQVEIRNEGTQIQRGVENKLNEKMNETHQIIHQLDEKVQTKLSRQHTLMWGMIVVSLVSIAVTITLFVVK